MTWPPRAAVRQLSIALITLSWPRLTWPRLASRQAGPWSRKISATSRAGRSMTGSASGRRPLRRQRQPIERAHHRAQHVGGDVGIARGGVELGMTEQHLDHPHVDIALQEMRGERVAQRMRRDPAAEPSGIGRHVADAVELAHRYWPQ